MQTFHILRLNVCSLITCILLGDLIPMMQSILARTHLIYNDKDVVRPLNKLLGYNPIYEFEPFFERVSLRPSEVLSVLPMNLIHLGGDGMLRENFHAHENLGSSETMVVKLASCCPPLLVGGVDSEFVKLHDLLKRNPVLVFEGYGKKVYALFGRLLKLGFEVHCLYDSHKSCQLRVKNLLRSVLIFCFCKWSSCVLLL
ncbi:hypothetical protein DKX38_023042 [Salix brachista]|uniref:Uncharacterized protein n=1 Tax=Salix brachista TaxID=2182728 RepID=A0A5N5K5Q6_9ROSI|nr:hypothetical protein DKX38_023042 [Salix brachista]